MAGRLRPGAFFCGETARERLAAGASSSTGRAGSSRAGPRWREIPGVASPGETLSTAGPVARPVAAFVRLALRRAASGRTTSFGRLAVEDETGDFFRVLAARGEAVPGGLLVLLSRVDVPFGVFLAVASVAVWQWGGLALDLLSGGLPIPGRGLLP